MSQALGGVISLLGFVMFAYWAIKRRAATTMYIYVMLLLLFQSVAYLSGAYGRYLIYDSLASLQKFLHHPVAYFRTVPLTILTTLVILHAMTRIRQSKKNEQVCVKVLIVDDDERIVDIVRDGLLAYYPNLKILTANTIKAAKELYRNNCDIRLIVTDMRFPDGESGMQLIRLARNKTVLVAITGYEVDLKTEGVDKWLLKPFSIHDLANSVKKYVEN